MTQPTSKPIYGDRVRVVPDTGVIIRDPSTGAIVPPDGIVTRYSPTWARRVKEGAIVDHEPSEGASRLSPAPDDAQPTPTLDANDVAGGAIRPAPATRHLLTKPS